MSFGDLMTLLETPDASAMVAVDPLFALTDTTAPKMAVLEDLTLFLTSATTADPSSAPASAINILSYDNIREIKETNK